ncbi:MAG: GNAT family N-acetyltransferase [Anaerolineae bacterium]|nr:GNAT family N-acetyltransferase [Anaerolineae bacterium]
MGLLVLPEKYIAGEFVIRSYFPGDGVLLSEAVNGSYDHLKAFMPWAKPYQSVEESEHLVRHFRGNYLLETDFVLGIFDGEERRLLGGSGFHLREGGLDNCSAEIGMWIRADAAGNGLGTRVLTALLAWGFTEWPWERLAWRCDGRNLASRRIAEKAGLALEGVLRGHCRLKDGTRWDTFCYAILKSAWPAQATRG